MTLTVNNKTQYLEAGIDTMLNFARGDYANWTSRNGTKKLNDINEKMREMLVDWLIEISEDFRLKIETLFIAV